MTAFPRVMPAIITPFDGNGEFDRDAHARNVEAMSAEGSRGIVVAGSTGEGPYLDRRERHDLVATTKASAPQSFVMCGINAESVRQASDQVSEATTGGADAVLVATPGTLVRGSDVAVERFYRQVADLSPVPVFLYTVPRVTGYVLPTASIARLADHPSIVGVKDSGGEPSRILELVDAIAAGFVVYAGASRALLQSVTNGAHGAITASANYAFDLVSKAVDTDADAQAALTAMTAIVEQHGVAGTKAAARVIGRSAGVLRPPLVDVDEGSLTAIGAAIADAQR